MAEVIAETLRSAEAPATPSGSPTVPGSSKSNYKARLGPYTLTKTLGMGSTGT
jgi:hypothetical protein